MKTVTEHLRARLLKDVDPVTLATLRESEWSPQFEQLMRNRLLVGAFRYGRLHALGKPQYDRMGSLIRRAKAYSESGNLEMLVDIANMALLEFEEGAHPKRHFEAQDDGEHTQQLTEEDNA